MHAHTNGLVVAGRSAKPEPVDGVHMEAPPAWRSSDVDVGVDVRNDGASGLTNVAFRVTDRHGIVVAMDSKAILPYEELIADPSSARARVLGAPIAVKVSIPPRRLDQLPSLAAVKDLQGVVQGEIDATGTVLDPRVAVSLRTRGLHGPGMPADATADGDVAIDYDGKAARLLAKMRSQGKDLLAVNAQVDARARDFVEGVKDPAWKGGGSVHLASFPLELVPALSDRRIQGRVSGTASLDGLHENARVKAKIELDGLKVDAAAYEKGTITVESGDGKLAAKVRLDQKDGFLDAGANLGLAWGSAVAPSLDASRPVEAKVVAKAFRAGVLQPFVEASVPVLDGRIEADMTAKMVPGQPGAALNGKVVFHDGVVQLASLGEELRNVKATATLTPDGRIRVTDVFARGTQGEVHADADVKLEGTRLANAVANVRIPKEHPLDLSLDGQPIGELYGKIAVKAQQSPDAKDLAIRVDIPTLDVELPQVVKGDVMPLEEKENIHVGVYKDPHARKRFVKLPLDKEDTETVAEKQAKEAEGKLDVDVHLGTITITRGNQARIAITGNPKVSIGGGKTALTGQIRATTGWVDAQGKKFEIEKASVTFNGESPPDPVVNATAGWTAADSSRIYADFIGPVSTGKVTLRSEPPRPKNEILAMILFGTADGANPQPPPSKQQSDGTTKAAAGVGGGVAAQGLTDALDDLAGIKATARIDTTRSNNPRPELEFQISQKVSIAFQTVLGTPPITEPDKNYANVEYRFRRNWSLETSFGDRGTALLDAIWQKRY
jgi:translocation and assembly module TamB